MRPSIGALRLRTARPDAILGASDGEHIVNLVVQAGVDVRIGHCRRSA